MPETPDRSTTTAPHSIIISGLHSHTTLVVHADYRPAGYPLQVLSAKETVNIMMLGRAEAVKYSDRFILRGDNPPFRLPSVIRLHRGLHNQLAALPVAFTFANLAVRDQATCQYTGVILTKDDPDPRKRATFDHVIPRDKGGQTCWENALLSSAWANNLKANLSLDEFLEKYAHLGVRLRSKPWVPTPADMLSLALTKWRASWRIHESMPDDWQEFLKGIPPTLRLNRMRASQSFAPA